MRTTCPFTGEDSSGRNAIPRPVGGGVVGDAITRVADGARAGTLIRKHLHNGKNAIAFSGRVGTRALPPGAYRATLTATNKKGKGKPVTIRFTIVP